MITELIVPALGLVAFVSDLGVAFVPNTPESLAEAREELASQLTDQQPQGESR